MNNGEKTRPRLSEQELSLISYALKVLQFLADNKADEVHNLRSDLKRFAKILFYTGDYRAFKLYKPYKEYVLAQLPEQLNLSDVSHDAKRLNRRIHGLLKGKRFRSPELMREW